jgi:hypothetical protein
MNNSLTTHQLEAFLGLESLLYTLISYFERLTNDDVNAQLSRYKIKILNRFINRATEVMGSEQALLRLIEPITDDEHNRFSVSDAVVALKMIEDVVNSFRTRYHHHGPANSGWRLSDQSTSHND